MALAAASDFTQQKSALACSVRYETWSVWQYETWSVWQHQDAHATLFLGATDNDRAAQVDVDARTHAASTATAQRTHLQEEVLVDDSTRHAAHEGGQDVHPDILEVPEGNGRTKSPRGVHRAAGEGARSEGTHNHRKADSERREGRRQSHLLARHTSSLSAQAGSPRAQSARTPPSPLSIATTWTPPSSGEHPTLLTRDNISAQPSVRNDSRARHHRHHRSMKTPPPSPFHENTRSQAARVLQRY